MVKLTNFLFFACAFSTTAFSLQNNQKNKIAAIQSSKQAPVHSQPTFLKSEIVAASPKPAAPSAEKSSLLSKVWNENTKIGFYLAVWYIGNIAYNIYNKKASIALGKDAHGHSNAHWALSAFQLLVGVAFVVPQWLTGLRKAPKLTLGNWQEMAPIGIFAALAHAFSVMALSAGAVSFGQIVKAGEPVFAAATNALLLKDIDHPLVYAALIPIIGGVGLASLKELSFTWTALIAASAANQAAALKNVVAKGVMKKSWAKDMGSQNNYAVVTILALLATLPLVALFDAKDFVSVYNQVLKAGTQHDVLKYSLYSGLAFYIYNEASFLALDRLDPVTHSVSNTLKRVVIIVASCIVFRTPVSLLGGIGSAIAVGGTLVYSLAKKQYGKGKGGH